jgi:hypothetical protein
MAALPVQVSMKPRRAWGPRSSAPRLARGSVPPRDSTNDWISVAVRARFPKLAAALGDDAFHAMLAAFMARERAAPVVLASHVRLPEYLAETPEYPVWYGELAALDRAHVGVMHAQNVPKLTRSELTSECELRLVPAHAIVQLTTTVDELWAVLDDAAARCVRPRVSRPRSLDWPRTVLIWRVDGMDIQERTVDLDEASALRAAARGTSLVELSAGLDHARALDVVLQWVDSGVLRADC